MWANSMWMRLDTILHNHSHKHVRNYTGAGWPRKYHDARVGGRQSFAQQCVHDTEHLLAQRGEPCQFVRLAARSNAHKLIVDKVDALHRLPRTQVSHKPRYHHARAVLTGSSSRLIWRLTSTSKAA